MHPAIRAGIELARLAAEEAVRGALPGDAPEILRLVAGVGWRTERWLHPTKDAQMRDELRRTFGMNVRTAEAAAREAHDLRLQARLESFVVPHMSDREFDDVARVKGRLAGPALVTYAHAGPKVVLLRALARVAPGLVAFGAPDDAFSPAPGSASGHAERRRGRPTATRRLRRRAEDAEALPVVWERSMAELGRALDEGRVVAVPYDSRLFTTYDRVPYLGRAGWLSPEPWRLAEERRIPVVPATIRRERDKRYVVQVRAPIAPNLAAYLAEHAEPWLRANPGHYAGWLAECRVRASDMARPLFADAG